MARIRIKTDSPLRDFSGAMTDISFLLIIFFIISAVFVTDQGILLKLPEPGAQPRTLTRDEVVRVKIVEPGRYVVDDAPVDFDGLRAVFMAKVATFSEPIVVLSVAAGVVYQEVLLVLEEARGVGYRGFSVSSETEESTGSLGIRINPDQ